MNEIRPSSDPTLQHTQVRYHGIGRAGWYVRTSMPAAGGATTSTVAGPFELDGLERALAAVDGRGDDPDDPHGDLTVREQVIEEGLVARIETAALEVAEGVTRRTPAEKLPTARRKKEIAELLTACDVYAEWCDS